MRTPWIVMSSKRQWQNSIMCLKRVVLFLLNWILLLLLRLLLIPSYIIFSFFSQYGWVVVGP